MSVAALPPPASRQRFRRALLTWYRKNGRNLPWRHTDDPYHILVSEVMLQQTQVDRVLPKYHEWLDRYPSLDALAAAPEDEVADTWRPLGYNIRPRRLHAIARESVARYGGELPSDEETLLSFKGHRCVHRGGHPELCVRATSCDSRHQRRARALSCVRGPRRRQGPFDAPTPVEHFSSGPAVQAGLRFQPGAHGPGSHGLCREKAAVRDLPDSQDVPLVPGPEHGLAWNDRRAWWKSWPRSSKTMTAFC